MPKVLVNDATTSASGLADGGDQAPSTGALVLNSVPKVGVWVWTFVGLVLVLIIVATALSAVSEIVLPLTFAAVLAIIFKPLVGVLKRHKVKPTLAAGVVVLGLLAVMILVVVATIRGVSDQVAQIGASVDAALASAGETLEVDPASLEAARAAAEELAPAITTGFLTHLVEGVGTLVGWPAL
jgi:putative heme transporter